MAAKTHYEALIRRIDQAAESHPRSYVVIDGGTMEVIATGKSASAIAPKIQASMRKGRTPVVYKQPKKNELLIL